MPRAVALVHHPLLRHGGRLVAGRRGLALRVALLSCFAALFGLLQPWLSKILVDDGALGGDLRVLAISAAAMLLAPLLGLAIETLTRFDYLRLSSHVLFGLRERLFAHLQRLPPGYYAKIGFGDLIARFDGDIAEIQRFLVDGPLALVNGVFNLLAITLLMLAMEPTLAAVVVASVLPAALWQALRSRRPQEDATREVRRQSTRLSAYFLDSLRALKAIQSANGEALRLEGLRERHDDYYRALKAAHEAGFAASVSQRIATLAGTVVVFGGGGYLLADGRISVGTLVAFVAFAARIGGPVQTLAGLLGGWQRVKVSIERLSEVFDQAPAAAGSHPGPVSFHGEVRFEAVDFAHIPGRPVFRKASLQIPAGSRVLLEGPSGSGKSTLADLLLRHLEPDAGRVLVDGFDLAGIEAAEWRRRIAVVDQEPGFLPGSIAENLRLAAPNATDRELLAGLEAVGLTAEGLSLTSELGAIGPALSRGQRLRLALARAMLQKPVLLVLDETTSALDPEAENGILDLVDRNFAGRTRIVISHRRHRDRAWDLVCRVGEGRIQTLDTREASRAG